MSSIAWNAAIQQLQTDKTMYTITNNEKTNFCIDTYYICQRFSDNAHNILYEYDSVN